MLRCFYSNFKMYLSKIRQCICLTLQNNNVEVMRFGAAAYKCKQLCFGSNLKTYLSKIRQCICLTSQIKYVEVMRFGARAYKCKQLCFGAAGQIAA